MRDVDPLVLEHLEGLSSVGIVWVELANGTKHTIRNWEYYINRQRGFQGPPIDLAIKYLRNGNGLGYLVQGDAWVLDIDTVTGTENMPMLERFEDVCSNLYLAPPRVATPSKGMHAVFGMPGHLLRMPLKNHVCHPEEDGVRQEWDFKFGPRTLMVAPGTTNAKGIYMPMNRWTEPPVLDPRILAPQLELCKDQRPFLIDNRGKKSRIVAAQKYLRHYAPVSKSKENGHKALYEVAVMLVAYHDLDPALAVHLMTHEAPGMTSWNDRCVGEDGRPYLWSEKEIWTALNNAQDAVPPLGIKDYESAVEDEDIRWLMTSFIEILRFLPAHNGQPSMKAMDLFGSFQEMFGLSLQKGMASLLGEEIQLAIILGEVPLTRSTRKGTVHYIGVNPALLEAAWVKYEAQQRVLAQAL